MESKPPIPILVCDHQGQGLLGRFSALGAHSWRVETSSSVVDSVARARSLEPRVLVLDPLVEGGRAELEALLLGIPEAGRPAVLVLFDPSRPEPALAARAALGIEIFDVLARGAGATEMGLRIEQLVTTRERQSELIDLRHRALHDDGTGLLRPRAFQARLVEHFGAAQRHKLDLALVLIDLDRFGAVNKTFDHVVGDRILARVGEAVRVALRAEDVAGRIGGDEFAVVLPYTKKIQAAHVSLRLLHEIRAVSGRFEGASRPIKVTTSLGFETFDGVDVENIETLRAHAEIALRHAKESGGDRGIYYRTLRDR